MKETGWLIERGNAQHQDPPLWWAGSRSMTEWTTDSNQAIRFARAEDAKLVGDMIGMRLGTYQTMWTVVEHQWGL